MFIKKLGVDSLSAESVVFSSTFERHKIETYIILLCLHLFAFFWVLTSCNNRKGSSVLKEDTVSIFRV